MYTREQYEQDRRKAIEDGINPRLIMSYSECLAWDEYQAEMEREREREIAAEVAERDDVVELAEQAEEAAMIELAEFGCIEFEPQFNWHAKSTPDDRGWSRAVIDIIKFEGEDAEPLFELF